MSLLIRSNCFLCNKLIDEASLPDIDGYGINLWISLCKIFQVSPDESQLEELPSCPLCYSCHSLAVQSTEVLKKIELLQIELEELSARLKNVLREAIRLEGNPSLSQIDFNPLVSLRIFLSRNCQVKLETEDTGGEGRFYLANSALPDISSSTSEYDEHAENVEGNPGEFNAGGKCPENRMPEHNFRTFEVQGFVLKDLEIQLERLSQNFILNALGSRFASTSSTSCEDEKPIPESGEESSWAGESSTDESEDEDKYRKTRSRPAEFLRHCKQKNNTDEQGDQERYQCHVCEKVLSSSKILSRHMELHKDGNHVCSTCRKSYKSMRLLKNHMRVHRRDKICDFCGKSFNFYCDLRQHEGVHFKSLQPGDLSCKQCKVTFDSMAVFLEHRKQVHNKEGNVEQYNCHVCGKVLSCRKNLRNHVELHNKKDPVRSLPLEPCEKATDSSSVLLQQYTLEHAAENSEVGEERQCQTNGRSSSSVAVASFVKRKKIYKNEHVCEGCGLQFGNLESLKSHIARSHANDPEKINVICQFCGKSSYSRLQLLKHVRCHHQGKKCVCETCGKSFLDSTTLKRHTFTHSNDKPFTCELCGKGVIDLRNHQVDCLEKLNSEERNFQCSHCDKTFHLEISLKRHEKKHLNPDRFECEVCHKKFRLQCFLTQHRRSHFPEERIPCTLCSNRFRRPQDLTWHMEYDHYGNRETCSICGYEAKSRALFKVHERTHKLGRRFECDLCEKKFFKGSHMKRHRQIHEKTKNLLK